MTERTLLTHDSPVSARAAEGLSRLCRGCWQDLSDAPGGHRLKQDGIDVVVDWWKTHGRMETAKLIEGLEVIPRYFQQYRGIIVEEMDVDAILRRKPQVPWSMNWLIPTFRVAETPSVMKTFRIFCPPAFM